MAGVAWRSASGRALAGAVWESALARARLLAQRSLWEREMAQVT